MNNAVEETVFCILYFVFWNCVCILYETEIYELKHNTVRREIFVLNWNMCVTKLSKKYLICYLEYPLSYNMCNSGHKNGILGRTNCDRKTNVHSSAPSVMKLVPQLKLTTWPLRPSTITQLSWLPVNNFPAHKIPEFLSFVRID